MENIKKHFRNMLQKYEIPLKRGELDDMDTADMLLLHDIGHLLEKGCPNGELQEILERECHIRWDMEWRKTQYGGHPERLSEVYDVNKLIGDVKKWATFVYNELN